MDSVLVLSVASGAKPMASSSPAIAAGPIDNGDKQAALHQKVAVT